MYQDTTLLSLRNALATDWHASLAQLDPTSLVRHHISQQACPRCTTVISVGKAAVAMARGAMQALDECSNALVITPDGYGDADLSGPHSSNAIDDTTHPSPHFSVPNSPLPSIATVLRASHPIPDSRSVDAAASALTFARRSRASTTIALISGGTSSLLCAPFSMSITDKQRIVGNLLRSGASIQDCNTVRRHISSIKGGQLAMTCDGPVHSVIISDVVGGAPHDVGSGPTVVDPTTVADAAYIARSYLDDTDCALCLSSLRETLKPNDPIASRVSCATLATPGDLAHTFASTLRASGWNARYDQLLLATATELSRTLVEAARVLRPGDAYVVACEPTLRLPQSTGTGGRAGWVALHALCSLPECAVLWAAASDGADGNSGGSGACVFGCQRHLLDPCRVRDHLARYDDASMHASLGSFLPRRSTGTNLSDVYAVLRP